jgi:hypothetical protein
MLQFGVNHVANGSLCRDINIKLEDHYLFPPQRHQVEEFFFGLMRTKDMTSQRHQFFLTVGPKDHEHF